MRKQLGYVLILLATVCGYQNCAMPNGMSAAGSSDLSSSSVPTGTAVTAATSTTVPYSLMSGDQIIHSMTSVTEISNVTNVQNNYKNIQTFSADYDIHSMNGPMMIGITDLAEVTCAQLVSEEKAMAAASRKYFGEFDFTKVPSAISAQVYGDTVSKLANGFIGRDLSDEEMQIMTDAKADYLTGLGTANPTTNNTISIAVQTCTILLSSFDAVTL